MREELSDQTVQITSSKFTPFVDFNLCDRKLVIRGTCMPEFPEKFFGPVNDLLEKYPSFNLQKLDVEIDLDHFNSASAKSLYFMIKRINRFSYAINVYIKWHIWSYDEETIEIVKDIRTSLELPIDILVKHQQLHSSGY